MKPVRLILWLWGSLLGLLVLFCLLPLAGSPTVPGALLKHLPLGWWAFLRRNIPQMTWNWGLVVTGVLCSIFAIVFANSFLRALFYQFQKSRLPAQQWRRWPWRWTFCLYAAVWVLFAIAFGASGALRHSSWLIAYDKPWFQARGHSYVDIRAADLLVRELLLDNNDNLEATRKQFYIQPSYWRRQNLLADEFDVIFYGDASNKVTAYIIVPRTTIRESKGRFGSSIAGTNDFFKPISDLPQTVAELDAAYPMKNFR